MRSTVYTKDKAHPRIIFEINCDLELLTACVKDEEVTSDEILAAVKRTMSGVNQAILAGNLKREAEAKEV
jgi:hypothetical protein